MTTKKKYSRKNIGSVIKSNDPTKSNYIKFNLKQTNGTLTITDGQTFSVESKQFQLNNLNQAVQAGKLSEDIAEGIRERIEKIPDFVLAEIILVEKN